MSNPAKPCQTNKGQPSIKPFFALEGSFAILAMFYMTASLFSSSQNPSPNSNTSAFCFQIHLQMLRDQGSLTEAPFQWLENRLALERHKFWLMCPCLRLPGELLLWD